MSDKFKGASDIDDIIEQVNRLKKEKEAISGKDKKIESAANSVAKENEFLSDKLDNKSDMADMINKSLSDNDPDQSTSAIEADQTEDGDWGAVKLETPEAIHESPKAAQALKEPDAEKAPKKPAAEFKLDEKAIKQADKEFKTKKAKSGKTAALFIAGLVIILLIGAYIVGLLLTKDQFLPNTYINGVNVSGMTAEQAIDTIEQSGKLTNKIVFLKRDGSSVTLPYERFGYVFNTEEKVKEHLNGENDWLYFINFFKDTEINFDLSGSYDEKALAEQVKSLAFGTAQPVNAKIVRGTDGKFVIEPEKQGTAVDMDKVIEAAKKAVNEQKSEINLEKEGLYKQPTITSKDLEAKLEEVNKIFAVTVELDFDYTTEKVTYDTIADAFDIKDDGSYTIDQEVVWKWVEELRSKYDTLHKTRKFKSTLQGEIEINSENDYFGKKDAIFGYMLNSDETAKEIVDAFKTGESAKLTPVYYNNGGYYYDTMGQVKHDKSDEGDVITDLSRLKSYIEVDLTNQTLWYYENGNKVFECGVVSGLPTAERKTYPGVYQLWMKETNKIMKGETSEGKYETPCSFWNYISVRSIGIHDATWQSSFGGDRYKWAGSHGCVGVSYDSAKYIYDSVPLGTVVIMYY